MAESGTVRFRGWIIAGYFVVIGLVSLISPVIASYLPIGIFVLTMWLQPKTPKQGSATTNGATNE